MDPRRLRAASAVLGLLLMAMLGGIVLLMVSQQPNPASSPTPAAAVSPTLPGTTPTGSPQLSPSPTHDASPTLPLPSATPDAGSTPSPQPLPSPSPEPASPPPGTTPTPAAPTRELSFSQLGLDSAAPSDEEEVTTPRFFTFSAEGPGLIRAQLSGATGRAQVCLWQGDARTESERQCRTLRRGVFEHELAGGAAQLWTLSLIGSEVSGSPTVNLRLSFPTNGAAVRLEGFRFQGTEIEHYNGFEAEVRAGAAGTVSVSAVFDDGVGGSHPYRLIIEEIGGGPAQSFAAEGEGQQMSASTESTPERSYRIMLENPELVASELILLSAQLDWP